MGASGVPDFQDFHSWPLDLGFFDFQGRISRISILGFLDLGFLDFQGFLSILGFLEFPGGPDFPGFPFLDLGFLDFRESTQFSSSDFDWGCLGGVKN